ncbi:MAG TPA: hypothetical protein VFE63_21840 [Roseiarcus sp.]|jgi:hypothetical protein|nr:hypothetical protein [Roseiarcus sp.]
MLLGVDSTVGTKIEHIRKKIKEYFVFFFRTARRGPAPALAQAVIPFDVNIVVRYLVAHGPGAIPACPRSTAGMGRSAKETTNDIASA